MSLSLCPACSCNYNRYNDCYIESYTKWMDTMEPEGRLNGSIWQVKTFPGTSKWFMASLKINFPEQHNKLEKLLPLI